MDYPTAPEGTAAEAFFNDMQTLGMAYAGATGEPGGRFQCPHPGHEDDKPSLDVTIGNNGLPILNCKPCRNVMEQRDYIADVRDAGVRYKGGLPCGPEEVNWGERAQFERGPGKADDREPVSQALTVYTYKHADGTDNFRVKRMDYEFEDGSRSKDIRPMRYVRGRGYLWGLTDTERTPYLLDRFERWRNDEVLPAVIYLVEGEKAAKALVQAGYAATTFHGGTDAPRADDWVTRYGFDRFAEVRVWPDADGAGVEFTRRLLKELKAGGAHGVPWGVPADRLEPKDDAYDVIERGELDLARRLTREDADALAELAPAPHAGRGRSADQGKGKGIVPATPYSGLRSADEERPYSVSLATEPGGFSTEFLDREFRNDEGVLTFRHFDGGFWLWEAGRYVLIEPDDLGPLLTARLNGKQETTKDGDVREVPFLTRHKRELLNALQDRTRSTRYGLGGELLPVEGGIPFRNGWLDPKTGLLLPIGPERKVQWVLDAEYDPAAECPEWERFLASCGFTPDTDEYRLLRQWFGYLVSGSKKYEKGMLLIGKSRAGKGVMIRVAQALFGGVGKYGGATAVEVETLVESHGYESMPGKGLITMPETRFTGTDRKVNSRLLSLTSNDSVRINPKMKTPYSTNLPGRLMIGTNETPRFVEATDALPKRLLVVRFNVSHADNPDGELYDRLVQELAGIARWALDGIADLEENGKFTETAAGRELTEVMTEAGSYLHSFFDDCLELTGDTSDTLSNKTLHVLYREWRKENDAPHMGATTLNMRFTDTFPDILRHRNRKDRFRSGLAMKPEWARIYKMLDQM